MSDILKPQLHIDNEYFNKVISLPEEEKSIFLVELYKLFESKGRLSQVLDIAHRTMSEEQRKEVEEWISNKGFHKHIK